MNSHNTEYNKNAVGALHGNNNKHANMENHDDSEEDITWGEVFNMMYTDAKEIISPLSKIINYVAPDPNEEDSRLARAAFEEKMSKQIKQPIKKYKIGSPNAIHVLDENTGELISVSKNNIQYEKNHLTNSEFNINRNKINVKKRGLIGNLKEENVKDAREIIELACDIELIDKTMKDNEKEGKLRGLVWDNNNIHRNSSPDIKSTPSTHYNTDSSPNSIIVNSTKKGDNSEYKEQQNEEDNDKKNIFIPRLSLSNNKINKTSSDDDSLNNEEYNYHKLYSEREHNKSNRFERVNGIYHSHAYTMENLSNTIQRPMSSSHEEILKLYSKEELEKIKNFIQKTNELVYEGPLEKKNSWSWGYKLRWVKIFKCEMHYFLSPKESKLKGKTPLGIINFKVAEWSLDISSKDDKTFTITAHGNNSNGRGYQWRVPVNSDQSRKSWTTRIEKILKAAAFMQQLKGIIKVPI